MPNRSLKALQATQSFLNALSGARLPLGDEKQLQAAIAEALDEVGIVYSREHTLGPGDCVDFLVDGKVAVECKLRASKRQIYRQLLRYADSADVECIVLVTNTAMGLPSEIKGTPAYYFSLGSAWL